jgi:nitroreductase/NAD-dependent dihydropyrimidine dehydrogenase PreA subunit
MVQIDKEKCISCGLCVEDCVVANIEIVSETASVKRESCLLCGHCIAICPQNAVTMNEYPMDDVKEYNKNEFTIEPERLLDFIKFRRSVRHFKIDPIEDEILLKMIEAGRFTATGSNRQEVSYIVVRENLPKLRRLALEKLSESALQQAEQNPAFAGLAQKWTNMLESDKEMPGKNDGLFYNAPTILLLVSDSPVDAALAASNMELMAVAQGLGVLYCGFFVRAAQGNEKINNLLGLSGTQEVKICLVLGKPDVTYRRTVPRKPAIINWR